MNQQSALVAVKAFHAAVRMFFVACLLGAPHASAQAPVVGVLGIGPPAEQAAWDQAFGEGLRKLGYDLGRTLVIEYRWAHGDVSRYPVLARELVERKPTVIVAPCGPSLRAIREVSRTLPVIAICADESNFLGEVASLSHPGGNTTGVTFLAPESVGKRMQLLREMLPGVSRVAVLYQPSDPIPANWRELERLQPVLGLALQRVPLERAEDLEAAFETALRGRAQALLVFPTNRLIAESRRIAELARRHRLATVFEFAFHVEAGGLLSYGGSMGEWLGETVPLYVDKILKGTKPGQLPISQPTRFVLAVNLKTARMLGIDIPRAILARADLVIE